MIESKEEVLSLKKYASKTLVELGDENGREKCSLWP